MRIIIAGSRGLQFAFQDIVDAMHSLAENQIHATEIISGCAAGVDTAGEKWAEVNGVAVKRFPAYWQTHGRAAGPIRNEQMAEYGQVLLAVWDGKSKGTADIIKRAKAHGLLVYISRNGRLEVAV